MDGGYIEEFTNSERFCSSWVVVPGTSLLPNIFLGLTFTLIILYLLLGIAIVTDIFMESIEKITSKVTNVQLPDSKGNMLTIEKSIWNPSIANLTLMAFGSSAP